MSDARVPSPDFDRSRYERPNQDWICGHAAEGCPCRIGPSPSGQCRATTECQPQLVCRPGETKGTWKCTRPKEWGGPCAEGPLPDGSCCRPIARCRPERSLRSRRGLVVRATIAVAFASLIIGLTGPSRETFINPAPLSSHHTGPEFVKMARALSATPGQGCVACHREVGEGPSHWARSALAAGRASLRPEQLALATAKDFSRLDANCLSCHADQSFHQPNLPRETTCSGCHREHQGRASLLPVAGANCTDCHGDQSRMSAAAQRGRTEPAAWFARPTLPGVVAVGRVRPPEGFTQVIRSFATDHPEFPPRRPGARDRTALAFNHARHLAGDDVPLLNGKPLECASCHQPDGSGAFMQRVTFERNCRSCHALQFDERNPGLQLPHGDAAFVRAFLRSLPAQYADHAVRRLGLTGEKAVADYVAAQMLALRDRARTGELLEEQVFFSDLRQGPAAGLAGLDGPGRAKFAGCATCHVVTAQPHTTPVITPPEIPDRWMTHAEFSHAKHVQVGCTKCHDASRSRLTSDVLLPDRQTCVECHSPKGGVNFACTECHRYHNAPPSGWSPAPQP